MEGEQSWLSLKLIKNKVTIAPSTKRVSQMYTDIHSWLYVGKYIHIVSLL